MQYGNIDSILTVLDNREKKKCDDFLAAAQQEANAISEKLLKNAITRLEKQKKRFLSDMQEKENLEKKRMDMEEMQKLQLFKQTLVQEALADCLSSLENLSENDFLEMLALQLRESIDEQKPVIRVPTRYFDSVQKKFGASYDVNEQQELISGFILSYPDYDINHEPRKIFRFREKELKRTLMELLFT